MSNELEVEANEVEIEDDERSEEEGPLKGGFVGYPHINQFKNCVRHVNDMTRYRGKDEQGEPIYDSLAPLPKLQYTGTVKLHGTNAAITFCPDGTLKFQSRSRLLTSAQNDNQGFWAYANEIVTVPVLWHTLFGALNDGTYQWDQLGSPITVFGEWCGGKIQKGVALERLPQMFVAFSFRDEGGFFKPQGHFSNPDSRIYDIREFPTYSLEIDFDNPGEAQNRMIDITLAVEAECPVAKQLGKEGIGEGVVWSCSEPGKESSAYWFKVKGEKHSVSKVKTLNVVDVEKVNSLKAFTDQTVTENRLDQGLRVLAERQLAHDMKNTKAFIDWVCGDVMREEADLVIASQFDIKEVGKAVAQKAATWYKGKVMGV